MLHRLFVNRLYLVLVLVVPCKNRRHNCSVSTYRVTSSGAVHFTRWNVQVAAYLKLRGCTTGTSSTIGSKPTCTHFKKILVFENTLIETNTPTTVTKTTVQYKILATKSMLESSSFLPSSSDSIVYPASMRPSTFDNPVTSATKTNENDTTCSSCCHLSCCCTCCCCGSGDENNDDDDAHAVAVVFVAKNKESEHHPERWILPQLCGKVSKK